tara:strand:- start:30 stop:476 length:447 start_codon:yes stop_codon:yes gene_type:complete
MEIQNYSDYLIYPSGKVFSKKSQKYLKHNLSSQGYQTSWIGGKVKTIHRLLAIHYIENPNNLPCVDHIDRNRTNNKLNNLRWVTYSENSQNTTFRCDNKLGIKNISYFKSGNCFRYQKSIRGIRHVKWIKTLDEAISYKKSYEAKLIL